MWVGEEGAVLLLPRLQRVGTHSSSQLDGSPCCQDHKFWIPPPGISVLSIAPQAPQRAINLDPASNRLQHSTTLSLPVRVGIMETSIPYLAADPLFDVEKPFDTDVPVDHIPGSRESNHVNDERAVTVHLITNPQEWDLEKHGFCFIRAKTSLSAEDAFTRKREVQKDYWFEIEALLHERFPEYSRIECYDCTVS